MREVVQGGDGRLLDETAGTPNIVVYQLAWASDRPAVESDDAVALIHSVIHIDGKPVPFATGITVKASGGDFTEAHLHLCPASIRFVACTEDEWKALNAAPEPSGAPA